MWLYTAREVTTKSYHWLQGVTVSKRLETTIFKDVFIEVSFPLFPFLVQSLPSAFLENQEVPPASGTFALDICVCFIERKCV